MLMTKRGGTMEDGIIPELVDYLRSKPGSVICYSGGMDSTVLLRNAIEAIPDEFIAVFAELPTISKYQREVARENALALGVQPDEVRISWEAIPEVKNNGPDRCYHCKKGIFARVRKIADNLGFEYILTGDNFDDLRSDRPGRRAGLEAKVICPLEELKITRDVIEEAVESMGLPRRIHKDTCLATRYPVGDRITDNMLRYVEGCESIVRTVCDVGLLRVRLDKDNNALIQVEKDEIDKVQRHLKEVESSFILKGIEKVEIDRNGYRTV